MHITENEKKYNKTVIWCLSKSQENSFGLSNKTEKESESDFFFRVLLKMCVEIAHK